MGLNLINCTPLTDKYFFGVSLLENILNCGKKNCFSGWPWPENITWATMARLGFKGKYFLKIIQNLP